MMADSILKLKIAANDPLVFVPLGRLQAQVLICGSGHIIEMLHKLADTAEEFNTEIRKKPFNVHEYVH